MRTGQSPPVAGIYRALAEHENPVAYSEAVEQAHADVATSRPATSPDPAPLSLTERHSDYRGLLVTSP